MRVRVRVRIGVVNIFTQSCGRPVRFIGIADEQ